MQDNPRLEELRRRVRLDPASIAFAALAEEYRRAGRVEDAIATCVTGLKRHPSYLSARVTLGRALIDAGRDGEAQKELAQVLRTAPENLAAIRGLAEIHRRQAPADPEPTADLAGAHVPIPRIPRPALSSIPPTIVPAAWAPAATHVEHRTPHVEHRTPHVERRTPHVEHRTSHVARSTAQLKALEAFLEAVRAARGMAAVHIR